ncbi:uncharacterized protein GLRG_06358 [Colletotrichum graminicola M1.001]|uniref:Uncharacterized protein n=1 Tax=Colletotrichum graminicola (strain M1.001 / M2 / FGSC 10212) TaxID=645133 RepID=E3QK26_COLGM|nr:uncharacterized protein GLRG_06358 [Colletotrichum graminicola M1.001]EFQ31214.1 hypothetical protein GLRG_06358 [Colletotrichum graminicola M1.001]
MQASSLKPAEAAVGALLVGGAAVGFAVAGAVEAGKAIEDGIDEHEAKKKAEKGS